MMHTRWSQTTSKWIVCCLLPSLVIPSLTACRQTPGQPAAMVGQAPTRHAGMMVPYQRLRSRPDVAARVNAVTGLKWSSVLVEGPTAYVAAYPKQGGAPPPGARPRTGYNGPKLWDTQSDLAKQNPEQWIQALNQWHPPVDTYDNRPKARSGFLSPEQQARVRQVVQSSAPNVRSVLITTDVASAGVIRGYADYLEAGGDMTRYMDRFRSHVQKIWPRGATTYGANRPSATPNFGNNGRPADARTPVRGPVTTGSGVASQALGGNTHQQG